MRIVMTNIVGCLKNPDFKENFWREKLDETKRVTISLSALIEVLNRSFRELVNLFSFLAWRFFVPYRRAFLSIPASSSARKREAASEIFMKCFDARLLQLSDGTTKGSNAFQQYSKF